MWTAPRGALPAAAAGAALVALVLLGYAQFPGQTYLASDTQIYAPMLEHLRDPSVLARDPIATRPHLAFTIFDEVALALNGLTGAGFREVLLFQQLILRALGLAGVYLIATSLSLSRVEAVFVAALFGLGATIMGPAVLTIEYEPVPRGFALPLLLFSVGLAARGHLLAAGSASAAAFLYHPPSVYPFWAISFALALKPDEPSRMRRRIAALAPLAGAAVILFALSRWQAGAGEPQVLFGTIDAEQETLMRMRASYNWVSMWWGRLGWHYMILFAVAVTAFLRVRRRATKQLARTTESARGTAGVGCSDASQAAGGPVRATTELKAFLIGLPLIGALSLPVSWLLLERAKWAFIPQFQPARAILLVTAMALVAGACAALLAAREARWLEATAWFVLTVSIPAHPRVTDLLVPDLSSANIRRRVLSVLIVAGLALAAAAIARAGRWWSPACYVVPALAPFFLLPGYARVVNYTEFDSREFDELVEWARSTTNPNAMFLFPDSGRNPPAAVFRARALRAVYVDWKGGGQLNFMKAFGQEWWSRWQATMEGKLLAPEGYAERGIDYIVVKAGTIWGAAPPAFQNGVWAVFPVRER